MFPTGSCPLCVSTPGRYDDPRISFPILPNCVGDIRLRDTAHHNFRDGIIGELLARIHTKYADAIHEHGIELREEYKGPITASKKKIGETTRPRL